MSHLRTLALAVLLIVSCSVSPTFAKAVPAIPDSSTLPAPYSGCIVRAVNPGGGASDVFYARSPLVSEPWGALSFPVSYMIEPGVVSADILSVSARIFRQPAWYWARLGYPVVPSNTPYVLGQSGAIHLWVPGGVRFNWYANFPSCAGGAAACSTRIAEDDDSHEFFHANTTPLRLDETLSLGVNVLYDYTEPIRVEMNALIRECRP